MAVTIIAPMAYDSVKSPVPVSTAYDFGGGTHELTCKVGGNAHSGDPATGLTGADFHDGSVSVGAGSHAVEALSNGGGSDSQSPVVVEGDPPVVITGVVFEMAGGEKKARLDGECRGGLTPAFVIAVVYEVNVATKARTIIAAGADVPKGAQLKWVVKLGYIDQGAGFAYAGRAFLYSNMFALLGTQTIPLK